MVRELPEFRGPAPGPAVAGIDASSSPHDIMAHLLTKEFKFLVCKHTYAHITKWRQERDKVGHPWGNVETSFDRGDLSWLGWDPATGDYDQARFENVFNLWVAAKIRVAQLKPEIPARALWGKYPHTAPLYDAELDRHMTSDQFSFLNRHMSFADPNGDADEDEDTDGGGADEVDDGDASSEEGGEADAEGGDDDVGGNGDAGGESDRGSEADGGSGGSDSGAAERAHVDTHRKRRQLTDQASKDFGVFWNPHQHVGMDEGTRATKHWDKVRIRFKASIHSGSLVDMLNDCRTYYCMWFDEQNWHSKRVEGEHINSIENRVSRAVQVLLDKGTDDKGVSTSNYCLSLDRGYGHMGAQKVASDKGIFTNAMMVDNRVGLPRQFIAQCRQDLECDKGCNHKADNEDCRKFMWTVVNKDGFELCLWQNSKLIISYGNFFSSSRCGELSRGSHGSKESYYVWVPESIWHYNIEGRSATDGGDQLRRKLATAERRITRAGHKGIAFVFDIAFSNGAVTWRFLQPRTTTRKKLDLLYTKVPGPACPFGLPPLLMSAH